MSTPVAWDDQRIFLAVLEGGSLSAAARTLGLSHPTVRARIEALEKRLGTVLFTRSVNGLTPTETAHALRDPARTMAMASDLFVRLASAPFGDVAGRVRVSVPEFVGIEVIPRMLARLHAAHPLIRIELVLSNLQADLLTQEVDVAVRTVTPNQEALVARKVASIPLGLYASRDYLERRGFPVTMDELAQHELVGPDRSRADVALAEKLDVDLLSDRFVLRTDSHPAQLAAARAGLGLAFVQVPVGAGDPNLMRVLPGFELARLETWIVTHENLIAIPRVRAVFDSLVEQFQAFVSGDCPINAIRPLSPVQGKC